MMSSNLNFASFTSKRKIISSIFPEKLIFDGNEYRTLQRNDIASLIYLINNDLNATKNRKSEGNYRLSGVVAPTGIEPISKV